MKPPKRTVTGEDVARHEGLIKVLARRLALGVDMIEDLEQEGRLEAWRALGDFDPAREVTEGTYVGKRAQGAMLRYLRDKAHMIRYPAYVQERRVFPRRVVSSEALAAQRREDDGREDVAVDPVADVEVAALAREELCRVLRRAHLTEKQMEMVLFSALGGEQPIGHPKALSSRKVEADRKIREAMAA